MRVFKVALKSLIGYMEALVLQQQQQQQTLVCQLQPVTHNCPHTQVLTDTAAAVAGGRSQAQRMHAVAVDSPPSELKAAGVHLVTDCFTDPCGWLSCSSATSEQVQWQDLKALQLLLQGDAAAWATAAGISPGSCCCMAIVGLSTLLLRHPTMQVGTVSDRNTAQSTDNYLCASFALKLAER